MSYLQIIKETFSDILKSYDPPKDLSLSEWADMYAYLSPESSAESGRWKTLPYQKGIMDAITNPSVEKITIMKSARVGYTKIINHAIGYHIHHDPCSMLIVQPTVEDAQGYSKDELTPMFRDTDVLRNLVSDVKSRDSSNTILKKTYPGGITNVVGANSARGFRRISVRKVFFDEADGYPPTAGQEGDQIKLGEKRTEYYWNRQSIIGSTPTVKGCSRVESSFERSNKQYYNVPCPHCKHKQTLKWSNIDFSDRGTIENPVYICVNCNGTISYSHHRWMIEHGEWIATAPEVKNHHGFHIWAAYSYSPNATWSKIVQEFLECKDDPEKLKTFVNTVLGETWEEVGVTQNTNALYETREEICIDPIPWEVGYITAGVDTQDNRLEILVRGWGIDEESYDLEQKIIFGQPSLKEVWQKLDIFLNKIYVHESGAKMRIACTCIDSGGHFTDYVHSFCKNKHTRGIFSTKGASQHNKPIITRSSKTNKGKVDQFNIGTHAAKDLIFSRFALVENGNFGPGYIHFNNFDYEYFEQLTSEKVITKYKKGHPYREYVKTRPRNEGLDLQVLALAALRIGCSDIETLNKYVLYVQSQKMKIENNIETQNYINGPRRPRGRRKLSSGIDI